MASANRAATALLLLWTLLSLCSGTDAVLLKYTLSRGLGRQILGHLTAWSVAAVLKHDTVVVEVPPWVLNKSRPRRATTVMPGLPVDWLFNLTGVTNTLRDTAQVSLQSTDWTTALLASAAPLSSSSSGAAGELAAGFGPVLLPLSQSGNTTRLQPLSAVAANLAERISGEAMRRGSRPVKVVDIGLPYLAGSLDASTRSVMAQLARSLEFSPYVQTLASKVVAGVMANSTAPGFNAILIDSDTPLSTEGAEKQFNSVEEAMRAMPHCFNAGMPVIILQGARRVQRAVVAHRRGRCQQAGTCSAAATHSKFLSHELLKSLPGELHAAVDINVALSATCLIGHGSSTFGFVVSLLRQARAGAGPGVSSAETTHLVEDHRLSLLRAAYALG